MSLNRRSFIRKIGTCAAGIGVSSALPYSAKAGPQTGVPANDDDGPVLQIGENIAVADTSLGKVRGFILNGIVAFRGIPYGADTSGARRFLPPEKPRAWEGVKPAIWWGNSAPQDMTNRFADQYQSFIDHWNYDELSEDCLKLNVWTPALNDNKKRPVMVWLHGGGFVAGNAIEQDGYHGENISRHGDIVFVSINHRLGALGFSNFAGIAGEPFKHSGNVGMMDIVAALEWVRDNIANFGGDPGNVTISGQSGGGAKVCTLAAMPSAKGLFHKAVALSGSSTSGLSKAYTEKLGAYILKEAGLPATEMAKLQQLPWKDYQSLANRAAAKLRSESAGKDGRRGGFSPTGDGAILPEGPYFSDPSGLSSDIPMIVCSTFNETSPSRADATMETVSIDDVKQKLRSRFKDKTDEVIDAYSTAFPSLKPVEIWSLVASNRQAPVAIADAKSTQKAPVFLAWFGFQPELFDNRMRAFHCLDISFWFFNTDRMYTHTGGGGKARNLSLQMTDSLLKFMRTGNPNGGGLPTWPQYSHEKGETMVLNIISEAKDDPDREARKHLPAIES